MEESSDFLHLIAFFVQLPLLPTRRESTSNQIREACWPQEAGYSSVVEGYHGSSSPHARSPQLQQPLQKP